MKYIASCSCGKDSLAMVYKIIEKQLLLDEIVFYDTGMEFQSIYRNWERLKAFAEPKGIKCTTLFPEYSFLFKMFDKLVENRDGSGFHYGYSWCGGMCRWGTTDKLKAIERYSKARNATEYVGIAADEWQRLTDKCTFEMETFIDKSGQEKQRAVLDERGCVQNFMYKDNSNKLYPLAEWKMTESDCLQYCYKHNITWIEKCHAGHIDLYSILDRVSCWCCANKNQWELYNYWKYLPDYWENLKKLQRKTERPFNRYTIFELEERFKNGYKPTHRKKQGDT